MVIQPKMDHWVIEERKAFDKRVRKMMFKTAVIAFAAGYAFKKLKG
jgi:hypothetical protein